MRSQDLVSADGVHLDSAWAESDTQPRGSALLVHGITVDMNEGGMFERLSNELAHTGFDNLRFSFRGHGASEGRDVGATIAGEMLDLEAAYAALVECRPDGPVVVVAASFGAVSVSMSLAHMPRVQAVVYWNPVLNLKRTFLEPELPWGLEYFGRKGETSILRNGFVAVEDFTIGRVMWQEFEVYDPFKALVENSTKSLIIHGDHDTYVSYEIAAEACSSRRSCELVTMTGSDHGFDSREMEDDAICLTVQWILRTVANGDA